MKPFILLLAILAGACGKPSITSLDPNSGPPHSIVKINGNSLGSTILWNADQPQPLTLPGALFGGGYFSVPNVPGGVYQVGLKRGSESSGLVPFTVTPAGNFPNPSITHLSTMFTETAGADSVRFILFVQGPNLDIGAKIKINNVDHSSSLWRVLMYNSAGHQPSTLKYPIQHYAMIFTSYKAKIGDNLTVSVTNNDLRVSNNLPFRVPAVAQWDSDGDGLLDTWEENGYDADNNGSIDCDLPKLGANKYIYDLFVEVDFMDGKNGTPDKIPHTDSWAIVEDAFRNSPFINLMLGIQGVQIHIDRGNNTFQDLQGNSFAIPASEQRGGQILPFSDYIRMDNAAAVGMQEGETVVNFYTLKGNSFVPARRPIFHYCIFANAHGHTPGSSGRGEIFGNDFFVTLTNNSLASPTRSAGTFMHELGHNLNLRHGGDEDNSRKPNHRSIMSYYTFGGQPYQFNGVDTNCDRTPDGVFDYSHGLFIDLNETALIETIGICDGEGIDWNGDGNIQNNSVSVNLDGTNATLLTDHNNWGAIRFDFTKSAESND